MSALMGSEKSGLFAFYVKGTKRPAPATRGETSVGRLLPN